MIQRLHGMHLEVITNLEYADVPAESKPGGTSDFPGIGCGIIEALFRFCFDLLDRSFQLFRADRLLYLLQLPVSSDRVTATWKAGMKMGFSGSISRSKKLNEPSRDFTFTTVGLAESDRFASSI